VLAGCFVWHSAVFRLDKARCARTCDGSTRMPPLLPQALVSPGAAACWVLCVAPCRLQIGSGTLHVHVRAGGHPYDPGRLQPDVLQAQIKWNSTKQQHSKAGGECARMAMRQERYWATSGAGDVSS
jgi:hypothetical protein